MDGWGADLACFGAAYMCKEVVARQCASAFAESSGQVLGVQPGLGAAEHVMQQLARNGHTHLHTFLYSE